MDNILVKLDELADAKAAVDATRTDYEAKHTEMLKTIQKELDALEAEYQPLFESAQARINALETEIKDAVLQHGASVKGSRLSAIYSKGRVTWDGKELERYATSHPEIAPYRKVGQPSVSLRDLKDKTDES